MIHFLLSESQDNSIELVVDTNLFSVSIAMKAAYTFLDRVYVFFRRSDTGLIVQFHPKEGTELSMDYFAKEYSDELLAMHLRDLVERENKEIRETIVKRALWSYADLPNFTMIPAETNAIDFDKDIDEILKEIENDPELKIDEAEIERILAEIEAETQSELKQKAPTIDPNKLKDVKKNFHHGS